MFQQCHKLYDANLLEEGAIDHLGKSNNSQQLNTFVPVFIEEAITNFLSYYREKFPQATTTVKLHLLEDHMIPFFKRWKVGFGLMGEQGAESIHASINTIKARYVGIPNRVDRLRCILRDHHLRVAPQNIALQPEKKKRNFRKRAIED